MKVAYLSAEVAPYAKTGGLGDVAGALPGYLRQIGVDCRVFMPRYGTMDPAREFRHHMSVPMGGHALYFVVDEGQHANGTPVYYIEHEELFGSRFGIYGDRFGEFGDNGYRFAAFCRAALEAFQHLDWWPDVIHAHDWHTGPAMAYAAEVFHPRDPRSQAGRVFTIHNQAYQGWQGKSWLDSAGLPWETYHLGGLEHQGTVNLLKAGIQFASRVTTVSPSYANEICTRAGGFGLESTLQYRRDDLIGILNGIDMDEWDPANDEHLRGVSFHAGDLRPKAEAKLALQQEVGLEENGNVCLIGMVTRLVAQKGIELLVGAAETLMARPCQVVVLGSGSSGYENALRELQQRYPGKFSAQIRFDNGLAHRIEAGADAFVMPSNYEPCGLNQMYSLRYGTLPIVRRTGGLADTVADLDEHAEGTGFVFDEFEPWALMQTIDRAFRWFYDNPEGWHWARVRAMSIDNSWTRSAEKYRDVYQWSLM